MGRILLFLTVGLLAGCASLSPEQCLQGDWRQIGFADGANGLSAARINDHAKACAEVGVRPNMDNYLRGREQGFLSYCQPENGFAIGRRGNQHNVADCPAHMKRAFLDEYLRGQEVHAIEDDLSRSRARLDRNHHQIRRNDEQIAAIRKELAKSDLPAERRTALLNDFNRLVEQKNSLGRENAYLYTEADRLQMHLQMKLREFGRWR